MNTVENFNELVGIKFQLYNSLFTSLPFHTIEKTGLLVSLLNMKCEEGYLSNLSPNEILDNFFSQHTACITEDEKIDLLFKFIQYIERQVVLFDALEDAAYDKIYDIKGSGTLHQLLSGIQHEQDKQMLIDALQQFSIRLVLTAHPTQFYRGSVLGIINDLSKVIEQNDANLIYLYLQQLGRTPFYQHQKPSPLDEAKSLLWYVEQVFYPSIGNIIDNLLQKLNIQKLQHPIVTVGFWPGGDRDGNPFVNTEITLQVIQELRRTIITCYLNDIQLIKRRVTFKYVEKIINEAEELLSKGLNRVIKIDEITEKLYEAHAILLQHHNGLFAQNVLSLINKMNTFGLYFASLDIRQDSAVHQKIIAHIFNQPNQAKYNYQLLSNEDKILALQKCKRINKADLKIDDAVFSDTLAIIKHIKQIQQSNSEEACHRYIISQCNSDLNVMEVLFLFKVLGWDEYNISVDIVPLFETVDDLAHAPQIMESLYVNKWYKQHLRFRGNQQTIMLGFSDGTKDGGYLMANWSIYKAKSSLTELSLKYGIEVKFFDGRGGPPSRGGGKTAKYYASMGSQVSNNEIQLTIQGQTVSSNFGTKASCTYNIEQLLHAGLSSKLNKQSQQLLFTKQQEELIVQMSKASYEAYKQLVNEPNFVEYLLEVSPIKYYAETNIASRPTKRKSTNQFSLKDVRAIPYVGAWSQIKQNVPGYYGVGTALKQIEEAGLLQDFIHIYQHSLFIRTLFDNCEMAMKKCYFPLTQYLKNNNQYTSIWQKIYDEYLLTEKYIKLISNKPTIMYDYPVESKSIQMRERIVIPLLTIQQYALQKMPKNEYKPTKDEVRLKQLYEKLVIRCSFGIINAGRNSA